MKIWRSPSRCNGPLKSVGWGQQSRVAWPSVNTAPRRWAKFVSSLWNPWRRPEKLANHRLLFHVLSGLLVESGDAVSRCPQHVLVDDVVGNVR